MIKRKPQTSTQTDLIAEAVSAESSHLVPVTSPPDCVVEISRYLESSVNQSGPNENHPGSDSDSGDSLFITQKPVPEAVRSGKRRHASLRSGLTFPSELEEDENGDEEDSLLASHTESKSKKKSRAIKFPKCDFPFLKEWKPDTKQNAALYNCATAGFFECVRELWKSRQRGQELQTSLPTVDVDGGDISPLSLDEKTSEDEDIRVVDRKQFVVSLKPKSSQPWYGQEKTDSQVKPHRKIKQSCNISRHETSCKIPDMTSTLSAPLPLEAKSNQHVTTDGSAGQPEMPNTKTVRKKLLFPQKEKEDELCEDSDRTLSDLSPEKCTPKRREASPTVTQPQADVFHTDELSQTGQEECEPESQSLLQTDTNNDTVCSETGLQRREKEKHGGDHQSTEEPAAQRAAASQNMKITEVEETPGVSQPIDEPASHEKDLTKRSLHDDNMLRQEEMDITETKQKREQSETEEVRQEAEADLRVQEDSVSNTENEGKKKKKKKRKRNEEEEERVEVLKSDEPLNDMDKNTGPNGTSDHMPTEESGAQESESSYVKRKKHKKKQQPVSNNDTQTEEDDKTDATLSNDGVTLAEKTALSVKKKKNRVAERIDVPHTEERTTEGLVEQGAELVTKKKKKKKKVLSVDDDVVAQSDDSVSVRKKEKKKTSSFLVADAERIADQKHKEKYSASPSLSEATHVWQAEKPAVSKGDFTTEVAENAEESDEGVRKKKKKKKKKKTQEKANETLQTDLDEIQVNIKKKQKKDESVSPTETSDAGCCQTDENIVSKKKKKKKKDRQEIQSAATEETLNTCSSAVDATVHDSSMYDELVDKHMTELAVETPEKQPLNDVRDKKKKKKQAEDSFIDVVAAREHKKKKKNKLNVGSLLSEIPLESSSSHSVMKNKHTKTSRLYNPNENFLEAENMII